MQGELYSQNNDTRDVSVRTAVQLNQLRDYCTEILTLIHIHNKVRKTIDYQKQFLQITVYN